MGFTSETANRFVSKSTYGDLGALKFTTWKLTNNLSSHINKFDLSIVNITFKI